MLNRSLKCCPRLSMLSKLHVPEPKYGDFKLSVHPFKHNKISLPNEFSLWEKTIKDIMEYIPLQKNATMHYVTIDSKYFTEDEYQRREGLHMDGNFCADSFFSSYDLLMKLKNVCEGGCKDQLSSWNEKSSWGTWSGCNDGIRMNNKYFAGVLSAINKNDFISAYNILQETIKNYKEVNDNSHVSMKWKLPYNMVIPTGEYVSDKFGGLLTISTNMGCRAWTNEYDFGDIKSGGDLEQIRRQLDIKNAINLEADTLYFMSSNTPHETLLQKKGTRRTLIRITLNHNYDNNGITNLLTDTNMVDKKLQTAL